MRNYQCFGTSTNEASRSFSDATPKQRHRALQVGLEDGNRLRDSGAAFRCETVGVGSADQDRLRAHADRLENIAASADAAVDQHRGLAVHRSHHFGERAQRGIARVELAPAVIRHDDAGAAVIERSSRIVARDDALRDDGAGPRRLDPLQDPPT